LTFATSATRELIYFTAYAFYAAARLRHADAHLMMFTPRDEEMPPMMRPAFTHLLIIDVDFTHLRAPRCAGTPCSTPFTPPTLMPLFAFAAV